MSRFESIFWQDLRDDLEDPEFRKAYIEATKEVNGSLNRWYIYASNQIVFLNTKHEFDEIDDDLHLIGPPRRTWYQFAPYVVLGGEKRYGDYVTIKLLYDPDTGMAMHLRKEYGSDAVWVAAYLDPYQAQRDHWIRLPKGADPKLVLDEAMHAV